MEDADVESLPSVTSVYPIAFLRSACLIMPSAGKGGITGAQSFIYYFIPTQKIINQQI